MAIYHFHCKVISRSQGHSAVGAAAYRSGTQMTNEFDGIEHDYTKKQGIVHSEVMLPEQAPKEYENRSILWNEVEQQEKSSKAQLAREVEVALPRELSRAEQVQLVRDYVQENFVKKGMCADIAIHDKGDGNPHAHIMLTTRPIEQDGSWGAKQKKDYILDKHGNKQYDKKKQTYKCRTIKTTDWDSKEFLQRSREQWGIAINRELERKNLPDRVDHRSFEEQGKEQLPTQHIGVSAAAMERRGIETDRGKENRAIQEKNKQLHSIDREIVYIKHDMSWTRLHEQHERLSKLVDEQKITAELLRQTRESIERMEKRINTTPEHKADKGRFVEYEGQKIPYHTYHTEKALSDLAFCKSKIDNHLAEQERAKAQPQAAQKAPEQPQQPQQYQKPQEQPQAAQRAAEQPQAAHIDIDQKARELSELRQTFVDEYIRSLERSEYRVNPIYQQQAYQIESLSKSAAEKGETIKQLQEQRGKLGLFKGKEKKALDEKIHAFSKYQHEDMEKLKALGVDDLSQAPQAIADRRAAAAQEQAKAEAAKQNHGAAERAQSAQAAFLSKVESIPQSQRQAVFERMERIGTEKPRGGGSLQMSMNRATAEVKARQVLDRALQQKSRVHSQQQNRGHDFDRSR